MTRGNYEIRTYNDKYKKQVLIIWEKSVLATHHFLTHDDFKKIKGIVECINFNDLQVFCLIKDNLVLGFVGVADKKIEMLFLDPQYFGKGFGQKLLNFAVKKLEAYTLDVNEQNKKALKFYQRFGFEIFKRTEVDDQGKSYPLLRMKLINNNNVSQNTNWQ